MKVSRSLVTWSCVASAAVLLAACTSTSVNRAPVEDRGTSTGAAKPGSSNTATLPDPKLLPGAENAGKPGYYSVKQGDTLIRIGLEHGQSWKDIVRWNNLENRLVDLDPDLERDPPVTPAELPAGLRASRRHSR